MYFYHASAQSSTRVSSSLVLNFTSTERKKSKRQGSSSLDGSQGRVDREEENKHGIAEEEGKGEYGKMGEITMEDVEYGSQALSHSEKHMESMKAQEGNMDFDLNLILNKSDNITIYKVFQNGIKSLQEFDLNGNLKFITKVTDHSFNIINQTTISKDLLFLVTESLYCMLLDYVDGQIIALSKGSLKISVGELRENFLGFVDFKSRFIALGLYEGLLQIIPLVKTQNSPLESKASSMILNYSFNLRVKAENIKCLVQIEKDLPNNHSAFAILSEEREKGIIFKCLELDLMQKDYKQRVGDKWKFKCEELTHLLIPVSNGGILTISSNSISYYNYLENKAEKRFKMGKSSIFLEYEKIDSTRFLLCNNFSELYLLSLTHKSSELQKNKSSTQKNKTKPNQAQDSSFSKKKGKKLKDFTHHNKSTSKFTLISSNSSKFIKIHKNS